MKDLDDVKKEMGSLYEEVRTGKTDLKTADSLANVAGKFLKAEQLQLAREIFAADKPSTFALPLKSARVRTHRIAE